MNAARLLVDGGRTLVRHPLRTTLSLLGALVGVAALTLVVAVGRGVEARVLRTVRQLFGPSSLLVMSGGGVIAGGPRAPGDRLTLDDLQAVAAALPQIAVWDPVQVLDGAPVRHGEASATARVVGSSERWERAWGRTVSRGEGLSAADVARGARIALVGETLVRELFGGGDPIGEELLVNGVPFRVGGVLEPFGTDAHGMDRDAEVVIPISTAMRRLLNVDTIRGAKIVVSDGSEAAADPAMVEATAAEVRRILRERHGLPADRPDDFKLVTPVEVNRMVGRMEQVLFLFLPLVAAVALLAGAATTAALGLSAVSARTAELGLRRALGARARDVALQVLVELTLTMAAGGVLGVVLGGAGALALAHRMALDVGLAWPVVGLGLLVAVGSGVLAGLLPARRAAALSPIDALR